MQVTLGAVLRIGSIQLDDNSLTDFYRYFHQELKKNEMGPFIRVL